MIKSSPKRLYYDFTSYLSAGIAFLGDAKRVCILGHGAGSIFKYISSLDSGQIEIHSVDIDDSIVDISKRFFFVESSTSHHFHIEDAEKFLRNNNIKFDYIIYDAFFTANKPPDYLFHTGFTTLLLESLTPHGLVAINLPAKEKANDFVREPIEEGGYGRLEVGRHFIYFLGKEKPCQLNLSLYDKALCPLVEHSDIEEIFEELLNSWRTG